MYLKPNQSVTGKIMKAIGDIEGKLFHRHFSEDTFDEFKKLTKILKLDLVTYVSVNSLLSTFKFISEEFIKKSDEVCVIIGIKGINAEDAEDKLIALKNFISNENKHNLIVYIHSRCHVKAFSADDVLYLGTQNVSKTSNSLKEQLERRYTEIYNDHELVIRVNDTNKETTDKIKKQLIEDRYSCHKLYADGVLNNELSIEYIRKWYDYRTIKTHIDYLASLPDGLSKHNIEVVKPAFELDAKYCTDVSEIIVKIYESNSDSNSRIQLNYFLSKVTGENRFIAVDLPCATSFREVLEELENLDSPISSCDEIGDIEELLKEESISDIGSEESVEMFEEIRLLIIDSGAHDIDNLLEHRADEIINKIEGAPGDYNLWDYQDNDGGISADAIERAIIDKKISKNQQLHALHEYLEELVLGIVDITYQYLTPIVEERLERVHSTLDRILTNELDTHKRIDA